MGPIPWSRIVHYAKRYDLSWDVTEAFVDIIMEMDRAYVSHYAAEQKKASDANKPKTKAK